ncbi:MAG: prepilin peptidase [Candidatus Delongbacteria bacterium]
METLVLLTPWWLALLLGLALGSFNNVLIHRVPQGRSLVRPGSSCPSCGRLIRPWENVPIVSWLGLRGRCAGCGWRIPLRYPLVELATALTALSVAWRVPLGWSWLVWLPALALLVALAVIDLDCRRLPNPLTAALGALGGLGLLLSASGLAGAESRLPAVTDALLGVLAGGGLLWGFAWLGWLLFKREGMGAGDVKLMAALGLLLGWQSTLLAIFLASLGGSIGGLLLRRRGVELAFGPWLALGSWLALLQGPEWIRAYLDWALGL